MAVMRGKFHVWGDGVSVFFVHGKDVTEESQERRDLLLRHRLGDEEGKELAELLAVPITPPELRTGVVSPTSFWMPRDVFMSLVIRTYETMTDAEKAAYRGPTAWELWYDEKLDI